MLICLHYRFVYTITISQGECYQIAEYYSHTHGHSCYAWGTCAVSRTAIGRRTVGDDGTWVEVLRIHHSSCGEADHEEEGAYNTSGLDAEWTHEYKVSGPICGLAEGSYTIYKPDCGLVNGQILKIEIVL